MPPDVRKAFGLPQTSRIKFGLRPAVRGRSPALLFGTGRKRRALPHIRRHSRAAIKRLWAKPLNFVTGDDKLKLVELSVLDGANQFGQGIFRIAVQHACYGFEEQRVF